MDENILMILWATKNEFLSKKEVLFEISRFIASIKNILKINQKAQLNISFINLL